MPLMLSLLAPLALLGVPVPAGGPDLTVRDEAAMPFTDPAEEAIGQQVRVEGRVILRVTPRVPPASGQLLRSGEEEIRPTRIVERPYRKCLAMRDIVATADGGSRLMLFMRGNRILAANLERACSPREFYRGFYLERSEDGMMCAGRDRLMARSGAKCQVEAFRELVRVAVD